ncbi:response regulator transcription factor [Desulfogranum marinum]|uniref:response regulator transcription factor n=1 Tax=Desulfogranum marinum TaxID=453220 RepID=UPI00196598A2|nr:response regulator transcription factor [Desulfogranum marinum]MBM9510888.1 response regulator transcription factor [Desulfogranum marinum]
MTEKLDCKLLVFEDDPNIQTMLRTYFRNQGAEVITADNGKDAYQRITATQPDVILLDVVMPHQDGLSILNEMRAAAVETPVIILTDRNRVDDKVKGLELGADDYLTKPFSLRELSARVKAQLRKSAKKEKTMAAGIHIGPLQIDTQAREISRDNGKKVMLTKTEFDLFAYLATRQKTVVTHRELLQEVLGYDPDIETKALVMHVANLRKKLESSSPNTIEILAVPGVGYKLSAVN